MQTCFDSLVSQSYEEWEAILVDDGSTDDSASTCSVFARSDARFHYYRKTNGGVSSARNLGLSQAKGDWILFVDADDRLPENAIQTLLQYTTEKEYDLIMGGYEVFGPDGEKSYWVEERVSEVLDRETAISLMFKPKYYRYLGFVWAKLFKASIIRQNRFQFEPSLHFNEDRLFVTQFLCRCGCVLQITEPVYNYYEWPSSAMSSLEKGFNLKFLTDLDGFNEMKEAILEAHCSKELIKMANQGIASSFWRIRGLMKRFHISSPKLRFSIHLKALRGLTLLPYLIYIVRPFFWNFFRRLGFKVKSA